MINKRRQNIFKKFLFRQSTLTIIGVIVLIAISTPLIKNIKKQYTINTEINELKKEISDFENKNLELKNTFQYLESDQFAAEQARKNLNYKKEGEQVVVIKTLDEDPIAKASDNTYSVQGLENNKHAKTSNAVLWWRYFFY